jgi:hypothetical protein
MGVPKATVHEDYSAVFGEHEIRSSRNAFGVQAISQAQRVKAMA